MDFLLPNDETMRRMANEYAKIKRICIPRRANAFAIDEESAEAELLKKAREEEMQTESKNRRRIAEFTENNSIQSARSVALLIAFLKLMKK